MSMTANAERLTLGNLAQRLRLPLKVLRRRVDAYGIAEPRRYPNQRRMVLVEKLPELRRRLRRDGFVVPEE